MFTPSDIIFNRQTLRNRRLGSFVNPTQPEPIKIEEKPSQQIPEEAQGKMDKLMVETKTTLMKISAVFPFDLFPSELIIDRNQVSCIDKLFFFSEQIRSLPLSNISEVIVETGLLFAKLKIIDFDFTENSLEINYLIKGQAIKVRNIIQGLIIAHKKNIDLSLFEQDELIEKTEELGKAMLS